MYFNSPAYVAAIEQLARALLAQDAKEVDALFASSTGLLFDLYNTIDDLNPEFATAYRKAEERRLEEEAAEDASPNSRRSSSNSRN
jgi:hypothetical protein